MRTIGMIMSKTLFDDLCESLDMNPQAAAEFPHEVAKQAFFQRLAEHGISPESAEQAQAMLAASDNLEAKTAAIVSQNDPVNGAISLLLNQKVAASPTTIEQVEQQAVLNRKEASARYLNGLLSDPLCYAGALGAKLAQQ